MTNIEAVKATAEKLYDENDETALEVLIAKCDAAVKKNPELRDDPNLDPKYTDTAMSFEGLKELGRNIVNQWNVQLFGIVCGTTSKNQKDRQLILNALNLAAGASAKAVAGAVAATLTTTFALPAAVAVAVAALIVKRFIWPARTELCKGWKEKIKACE